jgi:hypothetical protein
VNAPRRARALGIGWAWALFALVCLGIPLLAWLLGR